jgi:transposase
MSTSLLYHAFGIRGYYHVNCEYKKGQTLFKIKHDPWKLNCPICKSRDFVKKGTKLRIFKALPIGKKEVFIELAVQRIKCLSCNEIHQVKINFANKMKRYTNSFERYVIDLCRIMTISDVAKLLKVSWNTIKDIEKVYLKKHFDKPKLKELKRIAIDEIYLGKKTKYLTVIMDLETGAIVFTGDGKSSKALEPFWKKLKSSKAKIEAVAMDMGKAYIKAVKENLPEIPIVFDHFHVIKLYNEKLTKLRRDLQREAQDTDKDVLKGTRWLLLKSPKKLCTLNEECQKLKDALKLNEPLAMAYYLKDDLGQIWKQNDKVEAGFLLWEWVKKAASSGVKMLIQFAKILSKYTDEILAYYDFNKMSSGPMEGTNNKIKTLQKRAYGYQDMEFFKLKIMALHETRYALL